ncbi:MFS transporter [Saccharolobus shibatae]|uniref:Putative MFS-type transporter n=1 Tax=Saccharolobus shibatae TaxID=2286 RepID=A0A8F5C1P7_9CREN|nr:MFS transporter [Saccharolobus shibatae]QXJ35457.1 putative MFS-type transporter [Saccharolobus shibatae]
MMDKVTILDVIKVALASTIGSIIEWYDFFLYGIVASLVFPRLFFPPGYSLAAATLLSLTTYAVGFIARPIGAFIFGHIGDKQGRRTSLLLDLVIMGLASLIIGFLPSYRVIGFGSIIIAAIVRLIQGIAVAGEWAGAVTWLVETASGSRWRAFWGSWVYQGGQMGLISATLAVAFLGFNASFFLHTGWRIAFWVGALVAFIGIIIRFLLIESPLFQKIKINGEINRYPSLQVWKEYYGTIILLALGWVALNALTYIYSTYAILYETELHVARTIASLEVTIATAFSMLLLIIFSIIGDKLGRKKVLYILYAIGIIFSFPYAALLREGTPVAGIIAQLLITLPIAGFAIIPAFFAEQFPTRFRYSGTGLSYNIATPIGGALSPILLQAFIGTNVLGNWWVIGTVILIYFIISISALTFLKETRGKEMK